MAKFIIYEDDKYMRKIYIDLIEKFLFNSKDYYEIEEYDHYSNEFVENAIKSEGQKIYILDVEVPGKNGLDLAREIRNCGDIISPVIIVTSYENLCIPKFTKKTLLLTVISKEDNLIEDFWNSLKDAYHMITTQAAFTFSSFDEVYRIPYDDIYYIEKNINDDYVTIYTDDDSYSYLISIKKIEQKLQGDPRFFKCHRSCIVNLYKITSYDRKNNIIYFDNNTKTNLISRGFKKLLSERLDPSESFNK